MDVGETVEFTVRARFGKHSGASDYDWLNPSDHVPADLLPLCVPLFQTSASLNNPAAVISNNGNRVWLIRTYYQGMDAADRPVLGLEVAEAMSIQSPTPENLLGLGAIALDPAQQQAKRQTRESNSFSLKIPPISGNPTPPDPRIQARAWLGLPIGVSINDALFLTRQPAWNYRGICLFSQKAEHLREMSPFLCVNTNLPSLTEDEQVAIEAALKRQPSANEWRLLQGVEPSKIRAALRWSQSPGSFPSPFNDGDDSLLPWLAEFRGTQFSGAELLLTVKRDLEPHPLPEKLVARLTEQLSAETSRCLTDALNGNRVEWTLRSLRELAQTPYLTSDWIVPLHLWVHHLPIHGPSSKLLLDAALSRFIERGVNAEAASFVLDVPGNEPFNDLSQMLAEAARIALELQCPPPIRNLSKAWRQLEDPGAKDLLIAVCALYDPELEAFSRLILRDELPAPGRLNAKQMCDAIEDCREVKRTFINVLAGLLEEGRQPEAVNLFRLALEQPIDGLGLHGCSYDAIAAHLRLEPPKSLPPLHELRPLAEAGLIDPEDIVLPEEIAMPKSGGLPDEGIDLLISVARIWPGTAGLAALLSGQEYFASPDSSNASPDDSLQLPKTWLPAVQEALTPEAVSDLFHTANGQLGQDLRGLVSRLLGFDAEMMEALCGYSPLPQGVKTPDITEMIRYLPAYARHEPRAGRLRALCNAALLPTEIGKETALPIVLALLPDDNQDDQEFAFHALTKRGSMPHLDRVSADLIATLVSAVDVVELVDGLFACKQSILTRNEQLIEAIIAQLQKTGVSAPKRGYTTRWQLPRHLPMAERLAAVSGWESLQPNTEIRKQIALAYIRELGLLPRDLME